MKTQLLCMVVLSSLFAAVYPADRGTGIDEACSCDHCPKMNEVKETGNENGTISPPVLPLDKEDADGDGLSEICARARDHPDRSFPTVCHMLCHNRCTRFSVTELIEGDVKRYIATAYRTNYYKLRDGPCRKA